MKIYVHYDELYPDMELRTVPGEYYHEHEVSVDLVQRYTAARDRFLKLRKQLADAIGIQV